MNSFFEKRDRWGHGLSLWVVVGMVFLVPLALWSLTRIHLHNDIETWLPEEDPGAKALNWYHANFDQDERMLVCWEGSSLADTRVSRFASRLEGIVDAQGVRRRGLKQVEQVRTPQQLYVRMLQSGVSADEALQRLEGVLIGTGKPKILLTDEGRSREKSVVRALKQRAAEELGLKIDVIGPFVEWSPSGTDAAVPSDTTGDAVFADVEFPQVPPHDLQVAGEGLYKGSEIFERFRRLALDLNGSPADGGGEGGAKLIEDVFFAPGTPVAISVTLSEAGSADRSGSLLALRTIAEEIGVEPEAFHIGGGPVAGSALNDAVKAAAWNNAYPLAQIHKRSPILLSAVVGIALAFLMLRSFRLATLVQVVSYYTVLVTVAVVPATGGSMNMVLVVMPTLLLVLTTSGAIHVCNYWKYSAHHNMRTAVVEATRMARRPCFLAALTTAIGLLSLTTSPLTPVRDFGIYSALGCIISVLMVMYGLPALLLYWPAQRPGKEDIDRSNWRELGLFLARHKTLVSAVSIVIFVGSAYGLNYFRTETKAIRYFPDQARVVQDYNYLEQNLAGIVPVELVVRFSESSQDRVNGLTFYQRLEAVREIEDRIRQHPEISGAISLPDFLEKSPEPPADDAHFLVRARYRRQSNEVERRVKEENKQAVRSYLTLAPQAAHLHQPGDNGLNGAGDELWRITAQVSIMSDLDYGKLTADMDEIAKSVLKYYPGSGHVVTGMVPLFLRTQQAVLDSLVRSFILAFLVIGLVMVVLLRNPVAGIITMLPNVLPVGMVFGLISWGGLRVDIGTMITASVALGIAIDGTLHLLTWFRDGISRGMTRDHAVAEALSHCGPAMWQTSAAIGIGLLMLYPADLLLISRFGWLMASLIGAALLGDILLLPALLAGPLGALIERSTPLAGSSSAEARVPAAETVGESKPGIGPPPPHIKPRAIRSPNSVRID